MTQKRKHWLLLGILYIPFLSVFLALFDSILGYITDKDLTIFSWPILVLYLSFSSVLSDVLTVRDTDLTYVVLFFGVGYSLFSTFVVGTSLVLTRLIYKSKRQLYWPYLIVTLIVISLPFIALQGMGVISNARYDREKQEILASHTELDVDVGAAQISDTTLSVPISIVGLEPEYEPYYVAIGLRQRNPYRSFSEHHFTASSEDGSWMLETWDSERYSAESFTVSFSDETALPDLEKLEISIALQTKFAQFYSDDFPLQAE